MEFENNINASKSESLITPMNLKKSNNELKSTEETNYQVLIRENQRKNKKLECICLLTAIILTSLVNASAAIVAVRIKKEGAMDDEDFWSKERVVHAWKIYLFLCAAIALAVTLALLIATCKLVQTL